MASPAGLPSPLPLGPPASVSGPSAATAGAERSLPTSNPISSARNSMLLSSTSTAEKRLSTASNSSRNPPTSNQPSSSPSFTFTPSPASSPQLGKHRIPSFPPPQASRISIMSTLSSNRDSFHPQFVSSLSYTSVRDFAYPSLHPLHYGPSIASGLSTPAGSQRGSEYFENSSGGGSSWFTGGGSGYRRLSDPAHPSFDFSSASASGGIGWGESSAARQRSTNQPPPLNFSDGPPWSEDEDLQSPVVVPKHRKHKSSAAHMQSNHLRGQSKNAVTPNTLQQFATGGNGDEWDGDRRSAIENGIAPGGDYYTTRSGRRTDLAGGEPGDEMYNHPEAGDEYDPDDPDYYPHQNHYSDEDGHEYDDEDEGEDLYDDEDSRYSRDYQFQITSPDEEMSGKAVALFDFASENENELPLAEGQIVWVSYRHGQGWLVAQDPRTGDTGLIPEEYVRLFRDARPSYLDRMDPNTLTPSSSAASGPSTSDLTLNTTNININGQNAPVITTFSTSSQDVHPYPYQFHYATDHPPENPHHIRARSSPDFTGGETPTITSNRERIAQLQREQERAVAEESSTPRLRSGRFEDVGEGSPQLRQQENGDGGQNGLGVVPRLNGNSDVYYDAPERQGDGRSELDFRGNGNESNLQVR